MVGGFCLFGKVKFEGQECLITGRRKRGAFTLKTFWGQKIKDGASMKKLILVERTSGYMKQIANRQFLATQTV
ncbi:hypothetical protein IM774_10855 [Erysipelotrichaceae bacterium RD49]|nr:hypothetical protein [Erysipelotrichaceae bacterium RD49]